MAAYSIHGTVSKGYEKVYKEFEKNFIAGLEENAQVCVYVGEERVVDLWGSVNTSVDVSMEYGADTFTQVFSSTKSLAAIAMATLVSKSLLHYSDLVVKHWPEYSNGDSEKETMTVAQILRHQGGMPTFAKPLRLADIQRENIKKNSIGSVIEKEALSFPPAEANTKCEYHSVTRGWILNEIFRRIDPGHRTIGECVEDDIAKPLNAHVYIGLTFEQLSHCYPLSSTPMGRLIRESFIPKFLGRKTKPNIIDLLKLLKVVSGGRMTSPLEHMNTNDIGSIIKDWEISSCRTGEVPSGNGQCSARGLAKVAAMMANRGTVDGIEILTEETWDSFHGGHEEAVPMHPFYMPFHFSQGGVNHFTSYAGSTPEYMKEGAENRKGYIGWMGFGGSVFQWYPQYKIGFAYVPTHLAMEDLSNGKGAMLQKVVLDCVQNSQKETSSL